ncbi:uncharacterized protein N7469_007868 [Penicillium citrinum]|uniref:Uncharacterized protein n=2 Tax=Penicillium TaxID=5073 RepID=A0A9W9NQP1_PENCI|nr:uncharacterized protein N7469_007868 [Penicillium citrinum]KAJ5224365.1 hypothetical protein N7469_007868 [Penicillium citrinum]KAJ5574617.1 hypothetical protein N7450_008516 [Penicillium hetheringtonii]KAK5795922.1 hypothetical protein VI817_005207 [Penicillium citrinum]
MPKVGSQRDKTNGAKLDVVVLWGWAARVRSKRRGWRAFFLARFTAGRPELPPKVDSAIQWS